MEKDYRGVGYDGEYYGDDYPIGEDYPNYDEERRWAVGPDGAASRVNNDLPQPRGSELGIIPVNRNPYLPSTPYKPKEEKELTKEEFKKLKTRYNNAQTFLRHLTSGNDKTEELLTYLNHIYKEYSNSKKEFVKAVEEMERVRRYSSYSLIINEKLQVFLSWKSYDNTATASIYSAKRVTLIEGDLLTGYNMNSQKLFMPVDVTEDSLPGFEMTPKGVRCLISGIYDVDFLIKYENDKIRISAPSKEEGDFEKARQKCREEMKKYPALETLAEKLYERLSSALDDGLNIKEDQLKRVLESWQKLARIVDYEIYYAYDKQVSLYGTSY